MSLKVYRDLEQRSDKWYELRRGIVTASNVGALITSAPPDATTIPCPACNVETGPCMGLNRKTPTELKTVHSPRSQAAAELPAVLTVADNETSRGLTATLVAERIAGFTEDTPITRDMWRGIDVEPIARDVYSGHHGNVEEVGFMVRREKDWTLGYSPDGLVDDDGLIEVKAPRAKGQVLAVLADEVPAYNVAQIQAGLLVTGRKWLDFIPYVGGLPLWVKRIHPDPKWHKVIVAACRKFETTAAEMVADYEAKTAGLPSTERILAYGEIEAA